MFNNLTFLLADRRNGKELDESEGKLRIVIPHEKRHTRWICRVAAWSIRRPYGKRRLPQMLSVKSWRSHRPVS